MKKILLGSTTLIGAAALFAGAAFAAETPKVTVGGTADFQVGVVSEDLDNGERSQAFRSDTEITLRIDGKTDAGLQYGGGINLEADTTDDADTQGTNASKTFVYLAGANWGRVEGGSTTGVATAMKVGAESIARATGGIDGDFTYFLDGVNNGGTTIGQFVVTPDLPLDYGAGVLGNESLENANKVNYFTPRFAGFQAGISYIVDTNRGQQVNRDDNGTGAPAGLGNGGAVSTVDNIWEGGINYEGKFSNVGVALAATGTRGNATLPTNEDLRAWNVGGKLSLQGFSVAASYGDWGDSLRAKTAAGDDDTHYWTAGAAYETGPFGASVTYLDSNYDNATGTADSNFRNVSVGVDYKLAPGLTPYAEVSFLKFDAAPATPTNDNDATVFIAGTQLSF